MDQAVEQKGGKSGGGRDHTVTMALLAEPARCAPFGGAGTSESAESCDCDQSVITELTELSTCSEACLLSGADLQLQNLFQAMTLAQ